MALYEPAPHRRYLSAQLITFCAWVFITGVALVLHPDPSGHGTHTQLGLPPCPSVLLFNRPCPGCGLTTSFTALLHGQIAFAFKAHPFGPLLYLGFTAWALLGMYGWIKHLHMDTNTPKFNRVLTAFALVFFVFGIVRMAVDKGYASSPEERYVTSVTR